MHAPPTSTSAAVHWSAVVCKEEGSYLGWPSVARLPSGELVAVFSGGREEHVCPYGKTKLVRSADGGETWSDPVIVNDSLLDDRDAGIVASRSGTLVLSWFTYPTWEALDRHRESGRYTAEQLEAWTSHCDEVRPEAERQGLGHRAWTRRSADGGHSWEPPVDSVATNPHGPIELKDGRLLLVGNTLVAGETPSTFEPIVAMDSDDEGRSWRRIGTAMAVPTEGAAYHEPHVMELDDGTLICLARYMPPGNRGEDRYMRQSESADGGRTWTRPHPTNMWGFPPHLLRRLEQRRRSGDLRAPPAPLRAAGLRLSARAGEPDRRRLVGELGHRQRHRATGRRRGRRSRLPGHRGDIAGRDADGLLPGRRARREAEHHGDPLESEAGRPTRDAASGALGLPGPAPAIRPPRAVQRKATVERGSAQLTTARTSA